MQKGVWQGIQKGYTRCVAGYTKKGIQECVAGYTRVCDGVYKNVWQVIQECVAGYTRVCGRLYKSVWQGIQECVAGYTSTVHKSTCVSLTGFTRVCGRIDVWQGMQLFQCKIAVLFFPLLIHNIQWKSRVGGSLHAC
jgi:hypothetical protein